MYIQREITIYRAILKNKKNIQVPQQSKDNDIISDEPSGKKQKVILHATSSRTNLDPFIILEPLSSLRIKTKAHENTQRNYDKNSFAAHSELHAL